MSKRLAPPTNIFGLFVSSYKPQKITSYVWDIVYHRQILIYRMENFNLWIKQLVSMTCKSTYRGTLPFESSRWLSAIENGSIRGRKVRIFVQSTSSQTFGLDFRITLAWHCQGRTGRRPAFTYRSPSLSVARHFGRYIDRSRNSVLVQINVNVTAQIFQHLNSDKLAQTYLRMTNNKALLISLRVKR